MKKIIIGIAIGVCITMAFSMIQFNLPKTPIYNRIKNDEIIRYIGDFVKRGEGTHIDSCSKYLYLEPYHSDEFGNCWRLTYMNDLDHIYYQNPIMVCESICGKRIILGTPDYTFVAETKIPDMGEYFRDDLPEEYKKFQLKVKKDSKLGSRYYNLRFNYGKRELIIQFDGQTIVDTTYRNYDMIF